MAGNSKGRGRAVYSTLSDEEAFELCHADVRRTLRDCVFEWSAAGALNYQRKHGSAATVTWLRQWRHGHNPPAGLDERRQEPLHLLPC